MQEQFSTYLSFEVTEETLIQWEQKYLGDTIISVGFYSDSQYNEWSKLRFNVGSYC